MRLLKATVLKRDRVREQDVFSEGLIDAEELA
jgi:hypothetical protein